MATGAAAHGSSLAPTAVAPVRRRTAAAAVASKASGSGRAPPRAVVLAVTGKSKASATSPATRTRYGMRWQGAMHPVLSVIAI